MDADKQYLFLKTLKTTDVVVKDRVKENKVIQYNFDISYSTFESMFTLLNK